MRAVWALLRALSSPMELNVASPRSMGGAAAAAGGATGGAGTDHAEPATYAEKLAVSTGLHDDNAARFGALRKGGTVKKRTTYAAPVVTDGVLAFKITEDVVETSVADLLAGWSGPLKLTPVEDIFNDKLDYNVATWAQLEALNDDMLRVLNKFEILKQKRPNVVAATAAFVANFRAISAAIAAMEATAAGDVSVVDEVAAELAEAAALAMAAVRRRGVVFGCAALSGLQKTSSLGVTPAHVAFLKDALAGSGVPAPAFQLLYQASVDGDAFADVLRKCKGKGPVVVIGRETTGGWLFGGFMDCGISDEGGNQAARLSFVFTLTNPHGLKPTAWRRSAAAEGVIRDKSTYTVRWYGTLGAKNTSARQWTSDDGSTIYQARGVHDGAVFTGSKAWTASDVLIYRV